MRLQNGSASETMTASTHIHTECRATCNNMATDDMHIAAHPPVVTDGWMDRSAAALRLSCSTLTIVTVVILLLMLLLYLSVEYEWRHRPQRHASQLSGHREAVLEGATPTHSHLSRLDTPIDAFPFGFPNGNPRDKGVAAVGEHQPSLTTRLTTAPLLIPAHRGRAAGHWYVGRLDEETIQTAATDTSVEYS
mmetsp:Transcript_41809/g.118561  ORF Transcript_41809/g.118561 Transcript_41809/m.118561 type:complete len:192 (-) Transcript_41809:312-887(-)